jgi:tetratricopeptide (TPR) repeat protein
LGFDEKMGDKNGLSLHYGNLGNLYMDMNRLNDAERYLIRALDLDSITGSVGLIKDHHEALCRLYEEKGDYKKAYLHFQQLLIAIDTISNSQKSEEMGKLEAQHIYDTERAISEMEHKKELELSEEQSKKSQIISASVGAGLLLVLAFSIVLYRRFKITHRQKLIIEKQKEVVEEKQQEILDSIFYARRIQNSLLTPQKYISKNLERLVK